MTVTHKAVWVGVVEVAVAAAGAAVVAAVATDVGAFAVTLVEVVAVDWEHALRTMKKATARSVEILTR